MNFPRTIIKFIINIKKLLLILLIFASLGYLISAIFLPKLYECSITYIILPTNIQNKISDIQNLINPTNIYNINNSVITIANIIKDENFQKNINKVIIKRLNLKNINTLKYKVESLPDSNILRIKLQYNDPKVCFEITNIFSEEFLKYISELRQKNLEILVNDIQKIFIDLKNKIEEMDKKINEIYYGNNNINELLSYRDGYLYILNSKNSENSLIYQNINLSNQIKYYEYEIDKLEKLLKDIQPVILLKRSILDDNLFINIVEISRNNENLEQILNLTVQTEEINNVFNSLIEKLSNSKAILNGIINQKKEIENLIKEISKQIESLDKSILEKQNLLTTYELEKRILESQFNLISQNYINSEILKSIFIPNIVVSVDPIIPDKPIHPNILMNTLASVFLGLLLFLFFNNIIKFI